MCALYAPNGTDRASRCRGAQLVTVATTAFSLHKGVEFARSLAPEADGWSAYIGRVKVLLSQLQTLQTNSAAAKPTFAEDVEAGRFLSLDQVLAKSVPWAQERLAVWAASRSTGTALGVRDAAVLMMVAGDGVPNVRPSELRLYADPRVGTSSCLDPKCVIEDCRGSTVEVNGAGDVLFKVSKHKTAAGTGLRLLTAPAASTTARVWTVLVEEAAPFLRALAAPGAASAALMLDRSGRPLNGSGTMASLAARVLSKAGLPQQITSRAVRKAAVVAANDANLSVAEKEAMADLMGNSLRQWRRSYDSRRRERAAELGAGAYSSLVATLAAAPPAAAPAPDSSGVDDSGDEAPREPPAAAPAPSRAASVAPLALPAPKMARARDAVQAEMERARKRALLAEGLPAARKAGRVPEWTPRDPECEWMTEAQLAQLGTAALRRLIPQFYVRLDVRGGQAPDELQVCGSSNRPWLERMLSGGAEGH